MALTVDLNHRPYAAIRGGTAIVTILLGLSLSAFPQAQESLSLSPAEALVQAALPRNPQLQAQSLRVEAARQRVPQAAALPDPVATLQLTNISLSDPSLHDALTTGLELGVAQTLPGPGKRKLAQTVAAREVAVEEAKLLALQRNLRRDVLLAAYRYGLLERLLQINRESHDAQRQVIDAALAAYSAGLGPQADVLVAQSSLTRLDAERSDLATQREIARARLARLLARPIADRELEGLLPVNEPLLPPPLDSMLAALPDGSAEVLRARAESSVAEERMEVARKASSPDFMVGGGYRYKDMSMGGTNYLTATVGMSLPFFHGSDRYRPARDEALALQRSALEEERSALDEARYEVSEAHQQAVRDVEVYRLYKEGLLIQAAQAYESALASYTTGKSDMSTVLNALRMLYDSQTQQAMTRAEYYQSLAEMEALVGRPLSELGSRETAPSAEAIPDASSPNP